MVGVLIVVIGNRARRVHLINGNGVRIRGYGVRYRTGSVPYRDRGYALGLGL